MTEIGILLCGHESPHECKEGWRRKVVTLEKVRCNRPDGHEGNHAWSTDDGPRVAEWTQDGTVVR